MGVNRNGTATKYMIYHNGKKLKKGYHNGTKEIWSAGSTVTYYVDTGVTYTEEKDYGASCLAPSSFDAQAYADSMISAGTWASGWEFAGWREDSSANSSVLSSKLMESDPVVLYAVFRRSCSLKCVSYDKTETVRAYGYYNNTNTTSAIMAAPTGNSYSGWSWRGWSYGGDTAANAEVNVQNGGAVNCGLTDHTIYGLYQQDITVTYYNNSTSASSTKGTRYYNSAGNYKNPSFTLSQAAKSGMTARGWSTTNAGNATATYANNVAFTRDSNVTLYGMYEQEIVVTYYNNSTSASTSKGKRYWAPAGYINPSFKLAQASVSGWNARGWSTGTAGNSGVTYNNNTSFTRDSNCTLYGMYQKTVTLSYGGNGSTGGSTSSHDGTAYRNYAGTVIGATFTLKSNGFTRGGYNFTGWDLGAAGASVSIDANATAYAQWTLALPHTLLSAYNATPSDPYGRFSVSAPTAITGSMGTGYRAWRNEYADGDGDYNFSCSFKFTIYNHTAQAVVAVVSVSEDEYESSWANGGGNYNIAANSSVTVTVSGGGSGNTNPGEYCRVSARCDSIVIKSA